MAASLLLVIAAAGLASSGPAPAGRSASAIPAARTAFASPAAKVVVPACTPSNLKKLAKFKAKGKLASKCASTASLAQGPVVPAAGLLPAGAVAWVPVVIGGVITAYVAVDASGAPVTSS